MSSDARDSLKSQATDTNPVQIERRGDVLVATLASPPVNALSAAVRQGLAAALDRVDADRTIAALVIAAQGRLFSAGADIGEFAHAPVDPILPDLLVRLSRTRVPTIAAVGGAALGGGCELALACDYRVAGPKASFGLPEVSLGLIPGAGGTQRLPRLVGLRLAAQMVAAGLTLDAGKARDCGLVDRLAGADVTDYAVDFAQEAPPVADRRARLAAPIEESPAGWQDDDALARMRKGKVQAPLRAIEAVALASRLPLDQGLAEERRLFAACKASEEHAALRYGFKLKREVARHPELDESTALPVATVGVLGAGRMGATIALALLEAGYFVLLYDNQSVASGVATIEEGLSRRVVKGRLTDGEAATMRERLTTVDSIDGLAPVDLAIEAVIERMDVKQEVFAALAAVVRPDAVLATNTSYLDVDAIAAAATHPGRVVGMHFFNPADVMKLLEVVRGKASTDAALATALAVGRRMGKVSIVAANSDGFVGNRIFKKYKEEAEFLVQEGAAPGDVDAAMRDFGFAMGPLEVCDLAGIDIGWHNRRREDASRDLQERYSDISDRLYEAGRQGRKTGAGWYAYGDGRIPKADAAVDALVIASAQDAGIVRREISAEEIRDRLIGVMIAEGRAILADGIVSRAVEVDAVMLYGYAFPAHRGGPMFLADRLGDEAVARMLAAVADARAATAGATGGRAT